MEEVFLVSEISRINHNLRIQLEFALTPFVSQTFKNPTNTHRSKRQKRVSPLG